MRLNKFLALSGVASRRESDRLIQAATVTVNDVVIYNPAYQVSLKDVVKYNEQKLIPVNEITIIKFNKPENVITTARDPQNRKTIFDYIHTSSRLFPVGRLDKDSTGLVLVTNDGELANRLMHPRNRIPRIYVIEIDKPFRRWEVERMHKGVYIGQKDWGNAEVVNQVTVKKRTTVTLRLYQGKKREVRRLVYRMKRKLFSLKRTEFGPILLGDLPVGQWQRLTEKELASLDHLKPR